MKPAQRGSRPGSARLVYWALFAVVLCGTLGRSARADGGHFTPPVYGKVAEIPGQRALIAYRDGRETLIVESSYSTEARDVGWVIPLPSVPDRIQPVSSAAMKTLAFCLQPPVTHFMPDWFVTVCVTILIVSGVVAMVWLVRLTARSLVEVLVVVALLAILAGMLLPALATARSDARMPSPVLGVRVERQTEVGNYSVSLLRAQTPDALNEWLKRNGFMAVPDSGRDAVADYVRSGWCFAAAVLNRAEAGTSTPHPIRFDFLCAQAVYPMKLTALGGATPRVELYVVADRKASSRLLALDFCDSYSEIHEMKSEAVDDDPRTLYGRSRLFSGMTFDQNIGHPEIVGVLWSGCVVTKLSGSIRPEEMKEDLTFTWAEPGASRRHPFTTRGAAVMAVSAGVSLLSLMVFPALFFRKRLAEPGGRAWFVGRILTPTVLLLGVLGAAFYLVVPKTEIHISSLSSMLSDVRFRHGVKYSYSSTIEAVAKDIEERCELIHYRNAFTGEPVVRGDASPGNYDIRRSDGRLYFIYYEQSGAERWQVIADQRYDTYACVYTMTSEGEHERWRLAGDPGTPPDILTGLAGRGSRDVCLRIAGNPSTPETVLRMLAADRRIEFCARIGRNPAAPPSLRRELLERESDFLLGQYDHLRLAQDPTVPGELLQRLAGDKSVSIRLCVASNPATSPDTLASMAKDESIAVRLKVRENPHTPVQAREEIQKDRDLARARATPLSIERRGAPPGAVTKADLAHAEGATDAEDLKQMARSPSAHVRWRVAGNASTPSGTLAALAKDPDDDIRLRVAQHTSTPGAVLEEMAADLEPAVAAAAVATLIRQRDATRKTK